jgi:lipopolysaccharide/colanic/teichoic acid biosynthesis glycosyltransferase
MRTDAHHATKRPVQIRAEIGDEASSYNGLKRILDLIVSGALLILLFPVFALIGAAIAIETGYPLFYLCPRLGVGGKPMTTFKFRTMFDGSHHHLQELLTNDEEVRLEYDEMRKLKRDPRRTRVGAILRRLSLDELPQLLNVARGEMSLIGPRPYFLDELHDREEAAAILSVRPGITGLWQVSGRSDLPFERRLELDVEYVRRRSLRFDATIAARTIGAVLSGRGAY